MPLNSKDLEEITKHPENYNIYIKEGVDGIQLNEHNAKMLACDNGLIVLPKAEGTENMYIYATTLSAVSEGVKQKLNFKEQSKLNSNDKRLVYAAHANSTGRRNELLMTWEQFLTEESPFQHKKNQELISIIEETEVCIVSGDCLPMPISPKNARVLKYKNDKSLILYPSLADLSSPQVSGALYNIACSIADKDLYWEKLSSISESYKECILKCMKFVKFKPTDWEDYLNNTLSSTSKLTHRAVLKEIDDIAKMLGHRGPQYFSRELFGKMNRPVCVVSGVDGVPELDNNTLDNICTCKNGYVIFSSKLAGLETEEESGKALYIISKCMNNSNNFKYYYGLSTEHKAEFIRMLGLSFGGLGVPKWEQFLSETNPKHKATYQTLLDKFVRKSAESGGQKFCVVDKSDDLPTHHFLTSITTRVLSCNNGFIIYPSLSGIDKEDLKHVLYTLSNKISNRSAFKDFSALPSHHKDLASGALDYLKTHGQKVAKWEDFLKQEEAFGFGGTKYTNQQLIDEFIEEKKGIKFCVIDYVMSEESDISIDYSNGSNNSVLRCKNGFVLYPSFEGKISNVTTLKRALYRLYEKINDQKNFLYRRELGSIGLELIRDVFDPHKGTITSWDDYLKQSAGNFDGKNKTNKELLDEYLEEKK